MKSYKAAPTDKNKGNMTHGKFGNSGQKAGKKTIATKGKAMAQDPVDAKLRKISKAMFGRKKALNNDAAMRSQLNG